MDLAPLLHQYGYVLIFLGTLAEGETLLMLGGYFAHRGYLDLGGVIATSFIAAVCGDQLFFHLGRSHAKGLLARFPRLRDKVNLALQRVEQHQVKVVLSMRFLWGLRIALPVALGLTNMDARKFFWLNLLSASVWSCVFAFVGFGTSRLVTGIVDNLHHYEKWIAVGVLLVAALILWLRWHGARRTQG
jgi:membrane protein DedA with SNARE-associated domain